MIDANQPTDSATAPTASEATGAHIPAEDVAHRADDLVAGAPLKLGDFRIIREVGRGGMGVVFEAEEAALGRHVALKVMRSEMAMNPAARKRFLREARAMAAATSITNHDHVVTIHAVGEADGIPFISMPLLRGETLDDRLKREPCLPVTEVVRIGREIALGLAAAHEQGLVHRDIKPANVWLEANTGRVKVMDFGLARVPGDTDQNLTQDGAIVGTPNFMAPEQARGEAVDPRCDLFGLGSVLYRAATGELPFKGKDTLATLLAISTEQPRPPRELNPELTATLSDLILWLLTRDPASRPASALVVADALANLDKPTTSIPQAPAEEASATAVLPERQTSAPGIDTSTRYPLRRTFVSFAALVGLYLLFKYLSPSKSAAMDMVVFGLFFFAGVFVLFYPRTFAQNGAVVRGGKGFLTRERLLAAGVLVVVLGMVGTAVLFGLPTLLHILTYTGGLAIETSEPVTELKVWDETNDIVTANGTESKVSIWQSDTSTISSDGNRRVDLSPGIHKLKVLLRDQAGQPHVFTKEVAIAWGSTTTINATAEAKVADQHRRELQQQEGMK